MSDNNERGRVLRRGTPWVIDAVYDIHSLNTLEPVVKGASLFRVTIDVSNLYLHFTKSENGKWREYIVSAANVVLSRSLEARPTTRSSE